jgi:hypothetical protein
MSTFGALSRVVGVPESGYVQMDRAARPERQLGQQIRSRPAARHVDIWLVCTQSAINGATSDSRHVFGVTSDFSLVTVRCCAREDAISSKDSQLITPSVSAVAANGLTDWRVRSKNTPRRDDVGCSRA